MGGGALGYADFHVLAALPVAMHHGQHLPAGHGCNGMHLAIYLGSYFLVGLGGQ